MHPPRPGVGGERGVRVEKERGWREGRDDGERGGRVERREGR